MPDKGVAMENTNPPYFAKDVILVVQELGDVNAVRNMLESQFDISLEEAEGLDLLLNILEGSDQIFNGKTSRRADS